MEVTYTVSELTIERAGDMFLVGIGQLVTKETSHVSINIHVDGKLITGIDDPQVFEVYLRAAPFNVIVMTNERDDSIYMDVEL